MSMSLNNYHLSMKMQVNTFAEYITLLRKHMGFYDTYSRAFKDFLWVLDALATARVTCHIIDLIIQERYLKAIFYDIWKTLPNSQLFFQLTCKYYTDPFVSFTISPNKLLLLNLIWLKHFSGNHVTVWYEDDACT